MPSFLYTELHWKGTRIQLDLGQSLGLSEDGLSAGHLTTFWRFVFTKPQRNVNRPWLFALKLIVCNVTDNKFWLPDSRAFPWILWTFLVSGCPSISIDLFSDILSMYVLFLANQRPSGNPHGFGFRTNILPDIPLSWRSANDFQHRRYSRPQTMADPTDYKALFLRAEEERRHEAELRRRAEQGERQERERSDFK